MGYWLNSSNGIRCATCGREVHTSKCYGKKGYIRVELNTADRPMSGTDNYAVTSDCTIEFCSLPCLKNANWDKIYADFIKFEDEHMCNGYWAKHGTSCTGLEKSLLEQDPSEIPKPFFEKKPEPIGIVTQKSHMVGGKELGNEADKPIIISVPQNDDCFAVGKRLGIEFKTEPSIAETVKMERKVVPHCGMCNCDWTKGHENSEKHLRNKSSFESKMKSFRLGGGAITNTIAEIFSKEVKAEDRVEEFNDTGIFQDMEQAYCIIEMYDYGTVNERVFRNAVKYILNKTKENFGTDDYRYRELFALTHGEKNWEGTFEVRALCHAISLNCPHVKQEDCERSRTPLEEAGEKACERDTKLNYKRGECSHCRYLEGIKEKWDKKC